jgi:hypothetical protein
LPRWYSPRLVTSAGTALAVALSNDAYGGRAVVGAIPFTDSLDTKEATTDSNDSDINVECGASATDARVRYEVTDRTAVWLPMCPRRCSQPA